MYELTFIASPEISEEELQKLTAQLKSFFVKHEMDVKDHKTTAKKRFSYPINKKEGGFYVTFEFSCSDSDKLKELERELKEKKEIIRFLIINKPSNAKSVPVARPKAPIAPAKKAEKATTPKTKEEKEKEIKEIDKKLDEILKD